MHGLDPAGADQPLKEQAARLIYDRLSADGVVEVAPFLWIRMDVVQFSNVLAEHLALVVQETPRSPTQAFSPGILGDRHLAERLAGAL